MEVNMNIHKRFIIQFFKQLTLVFILFSIILLSVFVVIGYSVMNDEVTQDLTEADSLFFSNRITILDDKVTFNEKLKKIVKNQDGWLLALTLKGDVIGSYNAPEQVPTHFKESELAALMLQNSSAQIEYKHWKLDETDPQPTLLLYGRINAESRLLNIIKSNVDWNNNHLKLSNATLQQLDEEKAWVQLINSNGKVVDGYGSDKQLVSYTIQDLLTLSEDTPDDAVATYFDTETEQTILVGTQDTSSTLEEDLFKTISNRLLIILVVLFLLLIFITFWYANKFGIPLITIMKWIQNLGGGLYEQPHDLHQHPIMLNKNGKLKRKYLLYKDMIKTLTQLTETLQQNETGRRKMTQTREEWISGLSHDLKTPLSSITGYAQMLESEKHLWTTKETREFAGTIAEKSTYMMELLEDLTLTYQLKNQALPIVKKDIDINEFMRRTIIDFINDPANNDMVFTFQPHNGTVLASIDPKWFQRVIDNLLANAVKYNPSGTMITVSISLIEQHLMTITIEDDGIGMDKETLDKLFQRYYRGTNTSDSGNGTGLGMAITKQLVQLHGGSINVKSTPQEGTTVRIIFPVSGLK